MGERNEGDQKMGEQWVERVVSFFCEERCNSRVFFIGEVLSMRKVEDKMFDG